MLSSQSNITLILSPTCTTEHILYTTATLDWYTYRIWPYTVILFVIHNHVLHHRTHTVYKYDLTLVLLQNMTMHSYNLYLMLFVIHNHILHHRHNRTYHQWPIKTSKLNFSRFSDFYTFEYLIYLYTFWENLGRLGKIFLGEIRIGYNQ